MKKARESNYDLLRIISSIAVIFIHVSTTWLEAITNEEILGQIYNNRMLTTCFYNVLSRFAVPCFTMLSGAFILADERNSDCKQFYRKTFINVGIPTLLFSVFYFLFSVFMGVMSIWIKGEEAANLLKPIKNWLIGAPYYHMWYLYMMAGIYLLAPFILLFKKQVGEKIFGRVTWIFLVCASLGYWTSTNKLYWDIGASFRFVSYFMAGYELRKAAAKKKSNLGGVLLIIAGAIAECIVVFLRYKQALNGIADDELEYRLVAPLCPLIAAASVCIFAGFSYLNIKIDFGKMPVLTFYVYLFHAGVWTILSKAIRETGYGWNNLIIIPASVVIVFVFSIILSKMYLAIWTWLENKWKISDKFCKIIHLNKC